MINGKDLEDLMNMAESHGAEKEYKIKGRHVLLLASILKDTMDSLELQKQACQLSNELVLGLAARVRELTKAKDEA